MACESGFAISSNTNEAKCVKTTSIKFKGSTLDEPYECDPTDNSFKCELHHSGGTYLEVDCECSLDGNTGYCSSVIGT